MAKFYYNQNNYDKVSYDNPKTKKKETVASSGCGVCSACMTFNNLCGKELYTVSKMAKFSLSHDCRDNSGTNVEKLLTELCKKHKEFSFKITDDENKLVAHLKKGGIAIANQGDKYNVFSTAGHFVVAYKMNGKNIEVLDPQMYSGKYNAYKRPQRIVKKTSTGCVVSVTQMGKATADRPKAYFLVTYTKPKPKVKAPTIKAGSYTLTNERGIYKGVGANSGRKKVKDLTSMGKKYATSKKANDYAYLKAKTPITISETKLASSGNLWAKIPSGWFCVWEKDKNKKFVK